MHVINTADVTKLCYFGECSNDECIERWEDIVQKNYEINGGFDYINYKDSLQSYARLIADYNIVRCLLLKLIFVVDNDYIEQLKQRGYVIDTTNSLKYVESINSCVTRSENIVTRMKMKANELSHLIGDSDSKVLTFEEVIASLNVSLGFEVDDNITLVRFNEYNKMMKQRNINQEYNG
jgi:hypothetical protein